MEKVEIGIYKSYQEYFALGISGYKMRKIRNKDKYCLAFEIRNELNKKKIKYCSIRPLAKDTENYLSATKSELEAIVSTMSINTNNKKLEIKIKEKIYIKK